MVLEEARLHVIRHRECHPEDPDCVFLKGCAMTAIKALRMWVGEIPVAEWPIEEIH
jgi:hypothetical protein